MRRRFTLVLKGHIAIARAVFPGGATGAQLDSFARQALWQAGLDFDHGTATASAATCASTRARSASPRPARSRSSPE